MVGLVLSRGPTCVWIGCAPLNRGDLSGVFSKVKENTPVCGVLAILSLTVCGPGSLLAFLVGFDFISIDLIDSCGCGRDLNFSSSTIFVDSIINGMRHILPGLLGFFIVPYGSGLIEDNVSDFLHR
jgi:hypothetical protein